MDFIDVFVKSHTLILCREIYTLHSLRGSVSLMLTHSPMMSHHITMFHIFIGARLGPLRGLGLAYTTTRSRIDSGSHKESRNQRASEFSQIYRVSFGLSVVALFRFFFLFGKLGARRATVGILCLFVAFHICQVLLWCLKLFGWVFL